MCLGSGGSRSRSFDMDSGKPAFMSNELHAHKEAVVQLTEDA